MAPCVWFGSVMAFGVCWYSGPRGFSYCLLLLQLLCTTTIDITCGGGGGGGSLFSFFTFGFSYVLERDVLLLVTVLLLGRLLDLDLLGGPVV